MAEAAVGAVEDGVQGTARLAAEHGEKFGPGEHIAVAVAIVLGIVGGGDAGIGGSS